MSTKGKSPKQSKRKSDGYGVGIEGADSPRIKVNPNDEEVIFEDAVEAVVVEEATTKEAVVASSASVDMNEMKKMFESVLEANLQPIRTQMTDIATRLHEQENKTIRLENMMKASGVQEVTTEKRNIIDVTLDSTFGTVGKILHGLVDTTAFVATSVVDLATLGRAKNNNNIVR